MDTLPAGVHEDLQNEPTGCYRIAKKAGVTLLTHHECPALLQPEQLLLWPDDEPWPPHGRKDIPEATGYTVGIAPTDRLMDGGAIDRRRRQLSSATSGATKARLGQFLTPYATARFLASLFAVQAGQPCRLLDPGAGIGSLTAAFLERLRPGCDTISVTACEIDACLHGDLRRALGSVDAEIVCADFVETAVNWIRSEPTRRFTHVILNPPYKKISSSSTARGLLRRVGIETVNLYSAFVALSVMLLKSGGQLVAIIPRSFCNGPYYRPFRRLILDECAITHIHLFGSRNSAFKDDKVLQENVVIKLNRGLSQGAVTVSRSRDDTFGDYHEDILPFARIVDPNDAEMFIHIPTSIDQNRLDSLRGAACSLKALGLSVSTGPVVDFRVGSRLLRDLLPGSVPLIYPAHCAVNGCVWPRPDCKKPNALQVDGMTRKLLFPAGIYCIVKRFSAKEEKRRISASVISPESVGGAASIAFENHLNVYHEGKAGISRELAFGLSVFLNTSFVDDFFRRFNGHTQVNATDLRQLRYPTRQMLVRIGSAAMRRASISQEEMDSLVQEMLS